MATKSASKTSTEEKPFPFVFVSATEFQQNFSKYTKIAESGQDVIIKKNGKATAFVSSIKKRPPLLSDFVGILKDSPLKSTKDVYEEKRRRYEATGRY